MVKSALASKSLVSNTYYRNTFVVQGMLEAKLEIDPNCWIKQELVGQNLFPRYLRFQALTSYKYKYLAKDQRSGKRSGKVSGPAKGGAFCTNFKTC